MSDTKRDTALPPDRAGGLGGVNQIAGEFALLAARLMATAKEQARKARSESGISGMMSAVEARAIGMVAQDIAAHAQAMEARRAETLGSIHDSPVTEGDAPETPSEGVSNIKDKTDGD